MNKKRFYIKYFMGLVLVSFPFMLQSQELESQSPPLAPKLLDVQNDGSTKHIRVSKILYIPPSLGKKAPNPIGSRNGSGATRGEAASIQLSLLSPDHVAQTFRSQPTFYWHLSRNTQLPVIFTLLEFDADRPLIEVKIKDPAVMGFHSIQLKNYEIELEIDKTYEWSISLINDRKTLINSSADILAKAFVKRIAEPSMVINEQVQQNSLQRAEVYAKKGLWYESLEIVMGKDSNNINKQDLLQSRSELLAQVGITGLN